MQKRKKRFNSLSKIQKGILFFFVLVAVSLIGVFVVVAGGTNPFQFLFKFNTKNHSTKLSSGLGTQNILMDGEDLTLTKLPNRPEYLIPRNGATKTVDTSNPKEACESQILHRVFLKSDINIKELSKTIKDEANVDVEVKFYLIPIELQKEDPQDFFKDTQKFDKLLDVGGFEYQEDNGVYKNFFGSYIVFDNQFYDSNSKKIEYKYDWLDEKLLDFETKSFWNSKESKWYFPIDGHFTLEELQTKNNFSSNYIKMQDSDVMSSYEYAPSASTSSKKKVKVKKNISTSKIPKPEYISSSMSDNEKKYYIYGDKNKVLSDFRYPKIITKTTQNNDGQYNYDKIETLILINFWNEMILSDEFFEAVKKDSLEKTPGSPKEKSLYTDKDNDLTLFTQITYNLVDNQGKSHTLATGTQGNTKLEDMKLNNSEAGTGGGGSGKRNITVRARPRTSEHTREAIRSS